ncbi:hypothetical protein KC685_04095 [Candidatus Dojkabacteria bacterium]|uniref:Uncharacterized protein n=1 Tax=Candidatus Dojkabacteria bacterium TaxID=2099670 RepID=A0A955KXH1_9BACT|nr:hypothetical protein [Candidatus Dojkabacteria bacterium]
MARILNRKLFCTEFMDEWRPYSPDAFVIFDSDSYSNILNCGRASVLFIAGTTRSILFTKKNV